MLAQLRLVSMYEDETQVAAYPLGHVDGFHWEKSVGLACEMYRFGKGKLHPDIWIQEEKRFVVEHDVRLSYPVVIASIEHQ